MNPSQLTALCFLAGALLSRPEEYEEVLNYATFMWKSDIKLSKSLILIKNAITSSTSDNSIRKIQDATINLLSQKNDCAEHDLGMALLSAILKKKPGFKKEIKKINLDNRFISTKE